MRRFDSIQGCHRTNVTVWVVMCCFCISVVKDTGKGVEEEWERFDFNKDAPLDGDAQQDYFGEELFSRFFHGDSFSVQ